MPGRDTSILIVDDNEAVLEGLKEVLSSRFHVSIARDGEAGFSMANTVKPDLIILDIDLGAQADGVDLCQSLRNEVRTKNIPILMLTGSAGVSLRTRAFSAGADDFLEKPILPAELFARIDSKLRRWKEFRTEANEPKEEVIRRGNLVLIPDRYEAVINEQTIPLSFLEFSLLQFFLKHPEEVVAREAILAEVWDGVKVGARTIDAHLTKLRRKIEAFDHEIANVYGLGFILRRR